MTLGFRVPARRFSIFVVAGIASVRPIYRNKRNWVRGTSGWAIIHYRRTSSFCSILHAQNTTSPTATGFHRRMHFRGISVFRIWWKYFVNTLYRIRDIGNILESIRFFEYYFRLSSLFKVCSLNSVSILLDLDLCYTAMLVIPSLVFSFAIVAFLFALKNKKLDDTWHYTWASSHLSSKS